MLKVVLLSSSLVFLLLHITKGSQECSKYDLAEKVLRLVENGDGNCQQYIKVRSMSGVLRATSRGLTIIDNDSFKQAPPNITEVDLSNNQIRSIASSAFEGLNSIKILTLRNNQLAAISLGTFDPLIELIDLLLYYNKIVIIKNDLFKKNVKLRRVDLNFNKIVAIGPNVFKNLPLIDYLDLSGNICNNVKINVVELHVSLMECYDNYAFIYAEKMVDHVREAYFVPRISYSSRSQKMIKETTITLKEPSNNNETLSKSNEQIPTTWIVIAVESVLLSIVAVILMVKVCSKRDAKTKLKKSKTDHLDLWDFGP
jgi:hypothetical protein